MRALCLAFSVICNLSQSNTLSIEFLDSNSMFVTLHISKIKQGCKLSVFDNWR